MVTIIKLGGSLITDKTQETTLRQDVLDRLATEIHEIVSGSDEAFILGHGSGSFGHFEAKRHGTIDGVETTEQWAGFASVSRVAAELNFYVSQALADVGVPVMRVQPSASVIAENGVIREMAMQMIIRAMQNDIVPLVYGDVAFDDVLGGTIISTETIIAYLVTQLPVKRIILLGEVDGVYDQDGEIIRHITPDNFAAIQSALGGSDGVDVTGGMLTKVQDMLSLTQQPPYPDVYIINGAKAGYLKALLAGEAIGTRISR